MVIPQGSNWSSPTLLSEGLNVPSASLRQAELCSSHNRKEGCHPEGRGQAQKVGA